MFKFFLSVLRGFKTSLLISLNFNWISKNLKIFEIQNLRDSFMMKISIQIFLSLLLSIRTTSISNTNNQQEKICPATDGELWLVTSVLACGLSNNIDLKDKKLETNCPVKFG